MPILDRPLRPERLLLEEKGEALREGGRPCEAMPLKMACRIANTLALEFSSRTFTCRVHTQTSRHSRAHQTAAHTALLEIQACMPTNAFAPHM